MAACSLAKCLKFTLQPLLFHGFQPWWQDHSMTVSNNGCKFIDNKTPIIRLKKYEWFSFWLTRCSLSSHLNTVLDVFSITAPIIGNRSGWRQSQISEFYCIPPYLWLFLLLHPNTFKLVGLNLSLNKLMQTFSNQSTLFQAIVNSVHDHCLE